MSSTALSFTLLDEHGRARGSIAIGEEELILGRELVAKLAGGLIDTTISRRSSRVYRSGGQLEVEDLGSATGTLVNGHRIERVARLRPGDVVEVGPYRFHLADQAGFQEQPAPDLYNAATIAATGARAPERLRLVYELSRLVADALPRDEVAKRLHRALERSLQPKSLAVWLSEEEPIAGSLAGSPIARSVLVERVLERGQVLSVPAGSSKFSAFALPLGGHAESLGMVLVVGSDERPLSEEDLNFVAAASGLAGEALRRGSRLSALAVARPEEDEIAGESAPIAQAKREVDIVAPHADLSILLIGETGTGKELFARRIHRISGRRGPFVAVNLAAVPAELMESELFGHTKGAFTGATSAKTGYSELANGGTLFLDEIGEAPPLLQTKLLRFLQDRQIVRLGDPIPVAIDVRVVAATNANLTVKMQSGDFRQDLYYRIAGKEVRLPPLRERAGDVRVLVSAILARIARSAMRNAPVVTAEAMRVLEAYAWPGNVRQLESTLRLAMIHAAADGAPAIGLAHLDPRVQGIRPTAAQSSSFADRLAGAERAIVVDALATAKANKREAARLLGWSINTLRERIERHRIADAEWRKDPIER